MSGQQDSIDSNARMAKQTGQANHGLRVLAFVDLEPGGEHQRVRFEPPRAGSRERARA